MSVTAKICGLNAADAVSAAVAGGASHVGLLFYPPSPRYVTPSEAAVLAQGVPAGVRKVGLFVDADDDTIAATLAEVPLDLLQLHGDESVERVVAIRERFDVAVMKAVRVAGEDDVEGAAAYMGAVDWLLFDARAPKTLAGALPGGNALAFDWQLIAGRRWPVPWMLSGGLDAGNVAEAVRVTGARVVDVSSGVEDRRGHKSPAMIAAFLAAVGQL
ncbi:MAG: phosphoribosylanthranilate isomerase [Alphaproteobacteria bacterium]